MPDLSFSQPERRNFLVPIAVVAIIVAVACGLVYFFLPHRNADVQVTHVSAMPEHITFSSAGPADAPHVVGGPTPSEDDLYVLATVRIRDDLKIPLFIKDLTGTLTTSDGTDITVSAIEKNDLDDVYQAFPSIQSISGPPLLRETQIAPGATADGVVMLHYSATEEIWKQRKSASITIEFYHQDPITVPIPQ
jgi:hypothetical protein